MPKKKTEETKAKEENTNMGESKMTNGNVWVNGMMDIVRTSFENGLRNMEAFQSQTEQNVELAMKNMETMNKETQRMFNDWVSTTNKARKYYTDSVKETLNYIK